MPQTPLLDGTIKENLLMKPDATTEELMRAARIACAHDFIMEMPQGYNSPVASAALGLSGGNANAWPWLGRCCRPADADPR